MSGFLNLPVGGGERHLAEATENVPQTKIAAQLIPDLVTAYRAYRSTEISKPGISAITPG
jgi:hypothetical protein